MISDQSLLLSTIVLNDIYLLYKAKKPPVRPSDRRTGNSVVSACINVGLAPQVSYVLWHVQVCFKQFLSAIVCLPEG